MSLSHLQIYKKNIKQRWEIVAAIRQFFLAKKYLEVDVPLLLSIPGQEPYISPVPVTIHDEHGQSHETYLHTSPEYAMKKYLGVGFEKIFFLGPCFRNQEQLGGQHQVAFTMLEWYEVDKDYTTLMAQLEELMRKIFAVIGKTPPSSRRRSVSSLFLEYVGVPVDDYLNTKNMIQLCHEKKIDCPLDETYENAFYRLWIPFVEPHLGFDSQGNPCLDIVYDYPKQMAALAKTKNEDPRFAERMEAYYAGMELANGFSELTDAREQQERFKEEQQLRKTLGKTVFPIDKDLLDALEQIPKAAGIALGVDRIIMAALDCKNIDNVLPFPQSQITNM